MSDLHTTLSAEVLERYIDSHSFEHVLSMLREIAGEKADHLRTNWQDEASAKAYERLADAIGKAEMKAGAYGM